MKKTLNVAMGGLTAALYVLLTIASSALGISGGAVQLRLSEMLTVLPAFTPAAVPGLFVGCILANLITGCPLWDIILGSIATLLGALGTFYFGKNKWLAPIFPILSNSLIIPFVLRYVYGMQEMYGYLLLSVGAGEIISCGLLGTFFYQLLQKTNLFKMK